MTRTALFIRRTLPDDALQIAADAGSEALWVHMGQGVALMRRIDVSTAVNASTFAGTPHEVVQAHDLRPVVSLMPPSDLRRWAIQKHQEVFHHTFWWDGADQEALASFLGSRRPSWGTLVRDSQAGRVTIETTLDDAKALGEAQRLLAGQGADLSSVTFMQCVVHVADSFQITLHSRQPTDEGDATYAPDEGEALLYQTNVAALADRRGMPITIDDAESVIASS